jgi:pimeloyl-ACP methyl ester carboxylesterase
MAATNNPLSSTYTSPFPPASTTTHTISGIHVTIHGLSELPPTTTTVACLWLLHPRLQKAESMANLAAQFISTYNSSPKSKTSSSLGLICASFDQRNHGTRQVSELHNQAWREGNPRHAQDMFSCYHGTAVDTSQLITHLPSYILTAPSSPKITTHMVLGVSLGGHASWHCILSDPRISAAVVGIGCPDYTRLMTDRARLSKLKSYTQTAPPGVGFLGSPDFPAALMDAIAQYDPAGLLLPDSFDPQSPSVLSPTPSPEKLERMKTLVRERLRGKRILNLSGAADKLVPYAAGAPFLEVFKQVLREDKTLDVGFEDVLFEGVGHSFPREMADKAAAWICGFLAENGGEKVEGGGMSSKI